MIAILNFQAVDAILANAVLQSISRHLWYLTQELIPLSLCDDGVPLNEKRAIVQALITADRPQDFQPQAPVHHVDLLHVEEPCLHDFVGPRSWMLFQCLRMEDVRFLSIDPSLWENEADYQLLSETIHSITAVNDVAERAVRDVTQYIDYSQDAERNNDVILVVNSHRELIDFSHLTKDECTKLT